MYGVPIESTPVPQLLHAHRLRTHELGSEEENPERETERARGYVNMQRARIPSRHVQDSRCISSQHLPTRTGTKTRGLGQLQLASPRCSRKEKQLFPR